MIERLRPLEASESLARKGGMTPAVAKRLRVLLADPFRHCSAPLTPAQERLARQMGLGVALSASSHDWEGRSGFHITKAGRTGNPPGKQSNGAGRRGHDGTRDLEALRGVLESAGIELETVRQALKRGRPQNGEVALRQATREQLGSALRGLGPAANRAAVAELLGCSRSTLYRIENET